MHQLKNIVVRYKSMVRSSIFPLTPRSNPSKLHRNAALCTKLSDEEKEKELERIAKEASLDEPPTSCCRSGCANCVYIAWAEALMTKMRNAGPEIVEKIMRDVEDPSMRAYLELELRLRGLKK